MKNDESFKEVSKNCKSVYEPKMHKSTKQGLLKQDMTHSEASEGLFRGKNEQKCPNNQVSEQDLLILDKVLS